MARWRQQRLGDVDRRSRVRPDACAQRARLARVGREDGGSCCGRASSRAPRRASKGRSGAPSAPASATTREAGLKTTSSSLRVISSPPSVPGPTSTAALRAASRRSASASAGGSQGRTTSEGALRARRERAVRTTPACSPLRSVGRRVPPSPRRREGFASAHDVHDAAGVLVVVCVRAGG